MDALINMKYVVGSLVYSGLGIAILVFCFIILDLATPKVKLWRELCDNKNTALAVFLGSFIIGISIIISSAIHG